eukprot:13102841-Heterocapsa_arctica.AAC.1
MFSENDDPAPEDPAPQEVADDVLLGMSDTQRRRRAQDDIGHWPSRAGSSRPPYVHPEVWQTLSIT